MTDIDIAGKAGNVHQAANHIRDQFSATNVDVDTRTGDDQVTIRLEFQGFTSLEAALDRVEEVALRLQAIPETDSIHAGVNTDGGYDPHTEETDNRPRGWVNADLIHERELEAVEEQEP